MQGATRQEIDINPRPDQVNYVRDHWYFEGVEKITRATGLTTNEIYYTAYSILKLNPRKLAPGRGRNFYASINDVKHFNIIGKATEFHVRLPKIVTQSTGFGFHEKIPVQVKEDDKRITLTLFKKGTPPPFSIPIFTERPEEKQ